MPAWDDEAVLAELRQHVPQELGDPEAVLVLDPSGFPKKGDDSCGVARQWCGRLGKVDNCQVGVFLAYAPQGMPRSIASCTCPGTGPPTQTPEGHPCPEGVASRRVGGSPWNCWTARGELPHGWVAGDDEFGRARRFGPNCGDAEVRYVLDVPCNTLVRDLAEEPAPGGAGRPWRRVDDWARQPASRGSRLAWGTGQRARVVRRCSVGADQGEDGGVAAGTSGGHPDSRQRTAGWYTLSNAREVPLRSGAVQGRRHGWRSYCGGQGRGGLGHYEVRTWVGWHHHMTLSLLALWFLILEKRSAGEKKPRR